MSDMDRPRSTVSQVARPRRYIAVIQDQRGYALAGQLEPAPPEGPEPPMVVSVVKADDYEALEAERDRYREALEYIAAAASGEHTEFGAACGVDACAVCVIEEMAKGALTDA